MAVRARGWSPGSGLKGFLRGWAGCWAQTRGGGLAQVATLLLTRRGWVHKGETPADCVATAKWPGREKKPFLCLCVAFHGVSFIGDLFPTLICRSGSCVN